MLKLLTAVQATEPAIEEAAKIGFNPENFIHNLQYMGIGMLVIFAVIGIIVLTTMLINKVFAE